MHHKIVFSYVPINGIKNADNYLCQVEYLGYLLCDTIVIMT